MMPTEEKTYKVVTLGEGKWRFSLKRKNIIGHVGKTSIITRYLRGGFEEKTEETQ